MATETLQVVSRGATGRYSLVLDLNDGTANVLKAGGVEFTPPAISPLLVGSVDTEGLDSVGQSVGNGQVTVQLYVKAASPDALATAMAAAIATCYPAIGVTYFLKWQPYGATYPVFYEIVAPSSHTVPYSWLEFAANRASLQLTFATKPFGLGESMSSYMDFDTDTDAEVVALGSPYLDMWTTSGGRLTVTGSPTSPLHAGLFSRKGYTFADGRITAKFTTPPSGLASGSMFTLGLGLRCSDDLNDRVRITVQGYPGGGSLISDTTAAGSTGITGLAHSTSYWLSVWLDGNRLRGELWTSAPNPQGTGLSASVSGLIAAADGIPMEGETGTAAITEYTPRNLTSSGIDEVWVEPYAFYGVRTPDTRTLPGIPGDLDALADVVVEHTVSTGSTPPGWGQLAWLQPVRDGYTAGYNLCQNGAFETDAQGWDVTNIPGWVSGTLNTGGTIVRDTAVFNSGVASLKYTGAGTAPQGPEYEVFRRFRKGRTYTASAWVRGNPSTANASILLGDSRGADSAVSGNTAMSATVWKQVTVTWTPTADYDGAFVAIRVGTASQVFNVDDVEVYEGTSSVSATPQTIIPWGEVSSGVLNDMRHPSTNALLLEGWSLQSDGNAATNPYWSRWRQYLGYSGAVPATLSASMVVDPSSVPPGWFGVWARFKVPNTFVNGVAVASLQDEYGHGQPVYTSEYGSTGKPLVIPTDTPTNVWRWYYLGAFWLGTTEQTRQRFKVQVTYGSGSTGTIGLGSLAFTPMASSVAGRWDCGDAAADGFLPWHDTSSGGIVLYSNLRRNAIDKSVSFPGTSGFPSGGLVGSQLRLPPGDTQVFFNLTAVPPGDTTAETVTDDAAQVYTAGLRFLITPRYRFARGG